MNVLTQYSPFEEVSRLAGNKAKSLYALTVHGLNVPRWAALGKDVLAGLLDESGLGEDISRWLSGLTKEGVDEAALRISKAFSALVVTPHVRARVIQALAHVGKGPLAIRSSGVEEDSASHSFAGQFDSFLGVEGLTMTCEQIKKCWASAYSARALAYRLAHNLPLATVEMAVVVQRFVEAEKSGVVFTRNPTRAGADEMLVSSVFGLGEGLVSGAVDADTLTVERRSGRVKRTVLGEKSHRHTGKKLVEVDAETRRQLSLSPKEVRRICKAAMKVEKSFGIPVDIEWCIAGKELFMVQARPITAPAAKPAPEVRVWDNSNIIENYPGVTSPLTFSFAQHVYSYVFREFSRLLGLPERHLREMDFYLRHVLGSLNGRVYYNLLHWYKLSGLAPFQNTGRRMMELQMGVDEALDLKGFEDDIRPYHPRSRTEAFWLRLKTTCVFAWYFFTLDWQVKKFRQFFYGAYPSFDGMDEASMGADEVYARYQHFEKAIVHRWGPTIALESAIGLSYGLLRKLLQKWIPEAPPWLAVAVIGGVDDVESVEPAKRLSQLADEAKASPDLLRLLQETSSDETFAALKRHGPEGFVDKVDQYIRDFGYRSNNELKLEEPDMRQSPAVLFDMLKAAIQMQAGVAPAPAAESADAWISKLGFFRRAVFNLVRSKVKSAIRARETVRFCRSRAFGIARRLFRAIGDKLAQAGVLQTGADVFFLQLEEVRGCFEGTTSGREIKPLVQQRRADDAHYRQLPALPARFVTRGPVAGFDFSSLSERSSAQGELRGAACCPGIVEGLAKVVSEPNQFDGGILVTYRTDPGWVPVFASAKALLIERGSPLTHAAIVAREMGIPTIVQIPGLLSQVQSGMHLKVNGNSGQVTILEAPCQKAG